MTRENYLAHVLGQLGIAPDGSLTASPRSAKRPDYDRLALDGLRAGVAITPDDLQADLKAMAAEQIERERQAAEASKAAMESEEIKRKEMDALRRSKVHPDLMTALDAAIAECGVTLEANGILKNTATGLSVDRGQLIAKLVVHCAHKVSQRQEWDIQYGQPIYNSRTKEQEYAQLGGKDLLTAMLEEWIDYATSRRWLALRENLKHDGSDWTARFDTLADLLQLRAGEGPTPTYREACMHALAHWMWQVKRRLFSRRTKWELFLVLHGKQGDGKSWLIEHLLCGPIKDRLATKGLEIFGDTREHKVWEHNLAVNFDELAQNSNGERGYIDHQLLASMKALLTSTTITSRVLGVNAQHKYERLASCIGSTNHSLEHHFADETGMRRFFLVTLGGHLDREAVNAFDWLGLWRSIDENLDDGYAGTGHGRELLADVQRTYKSYSTIEEWIDLGDSVPIRTDQPLDGAEWLPMREAYETYSRYCQRANVKPKTLRNFTSELALMPVHKRYRSQTRPPQIAMQITEDA